MTKPGRPPFVEAYLIQQGTPIVSSPAPGVVTVVSVDGYDTVDMTPWQGEEVAEQLKQWAALVRGESA